MVDRDFTVTYLSLFVTFFYFIIVFLHLAYFLVFALLARPLAFFIFTLFFLRRNWYVRLRWNFDFRRRRNLNLWWLGNFNFRNVNLRRFGNINLRWRRNFVFGWFIIYLRRRW